MRSRDLYAPAGIWDDRFVTQLLYDSSSRRPSSFVLLLNLSGLPNRRDTRDAEGEVLIILCELSFIILFTNLSAQSDQGIERDEYAMLEQTWIAYVDNNPKVTDNSRTYTLRNIQIYNLHNIQST